MILDYGIVAFSNIIFVETLLLVGVISWFSMEGLDRLLNKKIETFCKGCGIPLIGVKWCLECWTEKCEIKEQGEKS